MVRLCPLPRRKRNRTVPEVSQVRLFKHLLIWRKCNSLLPGHCYCALLQWLRPIVAFRASGSRLNLPAVTTAIVWIWLWLWFWIWLWLNFATAPIGGTCREF